MFLFLCDINLELSHLRKKRNFIRTLGFGSFANFLITYFFWILGSVNSESLEALIIRAFISVSYNEISLRIKQLVA